MAKFSKISKMSKELEQELLIELCQALTQLRTPEESAQFLRDLLSKQEARMLAKRIAIARCLINGWTYKKVQEYLKVSHGTVSRVSNWLAASGEGYRLIVERVKPEEFNGQEDTKASENLSSWRQLKKKYSIYYWPELLLEEIITKAKKKEKERIKIVLEKFDEKSELFDKLKWLLRE